MCSQRWLGCRRHVTGKGEGGKIRRPLKYSSLGDRYGEENFVYLSSYVLASRSSDVSSQFGRLQSDQLQAAAGEGRQRKGNEREEKGAGGRMRIARIRRAKPEGKGADFYANICETLRHGKATHIRGMNTRRRGE